MSRRPTVLAILALVLAAVVAGCAAAPAAPDPGADSTPPGTVVMLVRHAEKPDGSSSGIDAQGKKDDGSLTPTGWQRADRLADLFDPAGGAPLRPGLSRPVAIYAAQARGDADGARTRETVAPLAQRLGVTVNTDYGEGQEKALVQHVIGQPGPTLISWQHQGIPDIAKAFPSTTPTPPTDWPDDRFDVIWIFTKVAGGWQFTQQPEQVLPQDTDTVISADGS